MEKLRNYGVSFAGLSLGEHVFDFHAAQSFFDLFDFEQDFEQPDLTLQVILDKKNNFLDLKFHLSGSIDLVCDVTNERYSEAIAGDSEIIVNFGEEFDDSDDEVWVIPQSEHTLNIAQMLYEMALLALPQKRIHPSVLNGESHSEMLELLEKYGLFEEEEESEAIKESNDQEIDPRWEQLKKLKKQ